MKSTLLILVLLFPCMSIAVKESNFASQTIDIGLVVTDLKKSLKFYKEVVGFKEKEGFQVGGKFPKLVGLTDGTDLNIHVLRLGDEETATKLKLMQVQSKKSTRVVKQPYIHSLAGISYLTIFVKNVDLVLSQAEKNGYQAHAKSPQILPKGLPQDVCLLMLKDPDGNYVEIVGPLTKSLEISNNK
jgi:catechol 2,3-dioxygenase-like lactoylglutathione lyase family enzyme